MTDNIQTWNDVLFMASGNNMEPDRMVSKTNVEWGRQLTPEQFRVTREKGTEQAFSSPMCQLFEPGRYACVCCDTLLFDATEKFESGTGWPSFTQAIRPNAVAYHSDVSHGMQRIEATCNTCQAHLGHVFPDGPAPSGLRYCINAVALRKVTEKVALATFGGGCFWCTEAIFSKVPGVLSVESGYSGGHLENPSYQQVCNGSTGHAEVIQITFDPAVLQYEDVIRMHLLSHDPTTLNQQGADRGTQYRSIILTHDAEQNAVAVQIIDELQRTFTQKIVTELQKYDRFYKAEDSHQDYYANNSAAGYCQIVIEPKLKKFRKRFADKLMNDE